MSLFLPQFLDYTFHEKFMIAGTQYADRRSVLLFKEEALKSLEKGNQVSLTMTPDKENIYDEFAIRLSWKDFFLGYIPASGLTCSDCLSKVYSKHITCKTCGSGSILKKGLSYRISKTSRFQTYYCWLSQYCDDAVNPFHCEVVWSKEQ